MSKHKGQFEYIKFDNRRDDYQKAIDTIEELDYSSRDLIEHFPAFAGHMTISRFLGLYELYKKVEGIAGHIGEVGIYKGASFLLFAKLLQIFERESLTQVHGFDWFQGTGEDDIPTAVEIGTYKESYERLQTLVSAQQLDRIAFIHKLDITKELIGFLDTYRHLQFKLVSLDAGLYNVVKTALPLFWERLTPGGVLVLDQYNHELSPGETMAVRELLPHAKVRTLPNIWLPSGYIIKE